MPEPTAPPPARRRSLLLAALSCVFRLVATLVILLDELVRPIYRPLIRRLAALALMQAFERWIAARGPLTVLALLLVPYATVEPLKFVALLWIAKGTVRSGTVLLILAHLVSFVLIERIFTAGKPKLMTIGWMAWIITSASAIRDRIVARLRLDTLKRRARALFRRLRASLRRPPE
ncbi:hypothetical protein FHS55_002318 [Angulomicrobium tetraedrale]|uniref:Uncharacterized protein n=1 Tax=Ancylobacter tetraedralis TaxID=217068 RepID=A0A839ZAE9_9HYPH|nr:hypothetical protein [Ancylobacter tetraedralis]MBB3771709.1 hypothetical protein [Ancylobacter tetraedralis]